MGKTILFWVTKPDGNIADDLWGDYHDLIAVVTLVCIVVFAGIIWALYRDAANRLLIRRAADPFGPYTPLYWLFVSMVPGLLVAGVAWYLYDSRFPGMNSFTGGAAVIGVYCFALTLVLAYAAILVATPVKFKYRARIWA